MESMLNFVYEENAKTKIATIAREMLGINEDIPDHIMEEISEQTIHFMNDMERAVTAEPEKHLYILADLFVANIITSSLMFHKLTEIIAAYEELAVKYEELKEEKGL